MREVSVSGACPVPAEQQPINEYEQLKESWFFSWATRENRPYLTTCAWIWLVSWVVSGPVAAGSFPPGKCPSQFFLSGAGGAGLFLTLALVRLYLGWVYVRDRLKSPRIFYEESGWYDGQCWTKTPEILTRDQLIVTYQIQPILQRLNRTFGFLGLLVLTGAIVWNFL